VTADDKDYIWSSMVSVDDHVVEPPKLWLDRLPTVDHDRCPQVRRVRVDDAVRHSWIGLYSKLEIGGPSEGWVDVWHYEDTRFAMLQSMAAAGIPSGDIDIRPATYDWMRPGCYQAQPRLADMDVNGVDVSLCFPNLFVRFCGQRFLEAADKELALRCVRAYNDWLVEEWAGPSGGRLHGAFILPLWDPQLAAKEVERLSGVARVVCFSEIPTRLGLPSLYSRDWDPLFAACERNGVVVAMHIGSSSTQAKTSDDAPPLVWLANHYTISSLAMSDWLLSGTLDRFPSLRIAFAESQAGWIPYLIGRLDGAWHRNDPYLFTKDVTRTQRPPSEYLRDHVYTCVFDDPAALAFLELLPEDCVCFETDYPHSDGTWPHSAEVAKRQTAGLEPLARDKILRENGLRMLGVA
jgi:predicted TIM-barrel fold metal-dependent hydrolase